MLNVRWLPIKSRGPRSRAGFFWCHGQSGPWVEASPSKRPKNLSWMKVGCWFRNVQNTEAIDDVAVVVLMIWWLVPKKMFLKKLVCVCELYLRVPTHKKVSTYTYLNIYIYIFLKKGPSRLLKLLLDTPKHYGRREVQYIYIYISANKGAVFGAYSFQGQYSLAQWPTFLLAFLEV